MVGVTENSVSGTTEKEEGNGWVPFAEPVPDWVDAKDQWGMWWEIHIYGVAGLFIMVFLFLLVNLILICKTPNIKRRYYFVTLHILMMIFAMTRIIFMLVDAYNARGSLHPALAYIFVSLGLPCMTSSFYFIFQAFAKALSFKRIQSDHGVRTILLVVIIHFSVSIALDVAAGLTLQAVYLLATCQTLFIILSYTLSILYFRLFYRMYNATVTRRRFLHRMTSERESPANDMKPKVRPHLSKQSSSSSLIPEPRLILGARLILISAVCLFLLASIYLGGLFGCFLYPTIKNKNLAPWPWWAFELAVRLFELALCWTISLAASQPITKKVAGRVSSWREESKRSNQSRNTTRTMT